MLLYGKKGTYSLSDQPMKSGGEGAIYTIENQSGMLAKIYFADRLSNELEKKLTLMMDNPPDASVLTQVAWPVDVLRDGSGLFVGFVMPKLSIDTDLKDIYVYPPKKTLGLTTSHKLIVALNICAVIHSIHRAGYVFGDFNPMNIGVNSQTGKVAFLDTDSYHITDRSSGVTYRCGVCLDGYVAPELIQRCKGTDYLHAPLPTFTQETDRFALAIHIFKLLMNGFTPFNGIKETDNLSTASPGMGNRAIEQDNYCFKPGNKPLSVATPDLSAFPPNIQVLFQRAFIDGKSDPKKRPSAEEWFNALLEYRKNLIQCSKDSSHYYYINDRTCPYCDAAERYAHQFATSSTPTQFSFVTPPTNYVPTQASSNSVAGKPSATAVTGKNTNSYVGAHTYNVSTAKKSTSQQKKARVSPLLIVVCIAVAWFIIHAISRGSSGSDSSDSQSSSTYTSVSTTTESPYVQDVYLVNYDYLSADKGIQVSTSGGTTNTGDSYSNRLYNEKVYSAVTYNLNGQYDYFKAVWALTSNGKDTEEKNSFDIYTDGVLAYSSPVLEAGSLPVEVNVSLNGCNLLTIMFKEGVGAAALMNPLLYNENEKLKPTTFYNPSSLPCWLTDLDYLTKDNSVEVYSTSSESTNTGDAIAHGLGSLYDNQSIEYYLRGEYKRISGIWALLESGRNYEEQQQFEIYADDVLVYTSPTISAGSLPISFDVDINYCQKLRIVFISAVHDSIFIPTALIGNVRLYPGDEGIAVREDAAKDVLSNVQEVYLTDLGDLSATHYAYIKKNTHSIYSLYDDHSIEFFLDSKYTYFTGRFGMLEECTRSQFFEVYADETLVYTSPAISTGSEDVPFSIDVSGVSILRIHFIQANHDTAFSPASAIMDAKIG